MLSQTQAVGTQAQLSQAVLNQAVHIQAELTQAAHTQAVITQAMQISPELTGAVKAQAVLTQANADYASYDNAATLGNFDCTKRFLFWRVLSRVHKLMQGLKIQAVKAASIQKVFSSTDVCCMLLSPIKTS